MSESTTSESESTSASTGDVSEQNGKGEHESKSEPESFSVDDKRALEATLANERKRWEKAERELANLRKQALSEDERAVAEAEQRGYDRAAKELRGEMLAADVRGLAGSRLADPGDAVRLLDLDSLVDEQGRYDRDRIEEALDDLVKSKPYLARAPQNGSPARVPAGARETAPASAGDDFIRRLVRDSRG